MSKVNELDAAITSITATAAPRLSSGWMRV
jgi:hypothetical protein